MTQPIVVKTRKVLEGRRMKREILFVASLSCEELPASYLEARPNVFTYSDRIGPAMCVYGADDEGSWLLRAGVKYDEDTFQCCLAIIRAAGERLAEILRSQPKWEGEETFVI